MKKPKIIFLKGIPGSGKSTWVRIFLSDPQNMKEWVRVNRDDLRRMRGQYWIPSQEDLITAWEDSCIVDALCYGYNVIVDATNLSDGKTINRVNSLSKQSGLDIDYEIKFFDIDVDEAIKRDAQRPGDECVGEEVIRRMYEKLKKTNKDV